MTCRGPPCAQVPRFDQPKDICLFFANFQHICRMHRWGDVTVKNRGVKIGDGHMLQTFFDMAYDSGMHLEQQKITYFLSQQPQPPPPSNIHLYHVPKNPSQPPTKNVYLTWGITSNNAWNACSSMSVPCSQVAIPSQASKQRPRRPPSKSTWNCCGQQNGGILTFF